MIDGARPLIVAILAAAWVSAPGGADGQAGGCADCNGDGTFTIDEIIVGVNIALGARPLDACARFDGDGDGTVAIHELIGAINGALYGCPAVASPTPTATPAADTPTPSATASDDQLPPLDEPALLAWLQAGRYRDWQAESAIHPGAGPHFGRVRTFVNDALFGSLSAATSQHPADAAAVKELYGGAGEVLRGWAVMRKLQADSDRGQGWHWYEYFNGGGGGASGTPSAPAVTRSGGTSSASPFRCSERDSRLADRGSRGVTRVRSRLARRACARKAFLPAPPHGIPSYKPV